MLSIPHCPHTAAAVELVEAAAKRLGVDVEISRALLSTPRGAARFRFLGSPTIRVNGHDVEPGADVRIDYALGCRIYRTPGGPAPLPLAEWVDAALGSGGGGREERGRRRPEEEAA